MLDPKHCEKIIKTHFENLTPEEFLENVKRFSPELIDDQLWAEKSGKFHRQQLENNPEK